MKNKKKKVYSENKKKDKKKYGNYINMLKNKAFVFKGSNAGYLSIPIIDSKEMNKETYRKHGP